MNRHLRTYRLVFATAIFATAIALTGIGRADSSEQFELREATIADIQAAYRDGILSPQHLVSMYLARIAVLDRSNLPQPLKGGVGNQPLNSFILVHVHEAVERLIAHAAAQGRRGQSAAQQPHARERECP